MKEIVRQIVAHIPEYPARIDCYCGIPIVEKYEMSQVVEWSCQNQEQGRRHDQAISIHWQVVMDSMQQEVQGDADSVIREGLIDMEEATMQSILDQGPDKQTG